MDKNDRENKVLDELKYTSEFKIKEEVIVPEDTSDSESTLSDNEKVPNLELNECTVCCKYHSMFIILKNHDCELGSSGECVFCVELSCWIDIFKNHKEIHEVESRESSGDSTASDREEGEGKCRVCAKYEFMIPLLKSHVCKVCNKQKCQDCVEVVHWTACFKEHLSTHEMNSSKGEKLQMKNSPFDKDKINNIKCSVCLKYEAELIILEEGHLCEKKVERSCDKCDEIYQLHECFLKHKATHSKENEKIKGRDFITNSRKFDCGICLKLNSIVRNLVNNHKCGDVKSCSVCKETSYWLSCVKNHKRSKSKSCGTSSHAQALEPLKKQKCHVCSKYQSALNNLSQHTCSRHKGNQQCEYCFEMSFWSRSLKRHANTHLPDSLPCKVPSLI